MAFIYPNFPANYRTTPSYLQTSVGFIPYWTKKSSYRERYTSRQGATSSIDILIDANDSFDFLFYALGFSRKNGVNISRNIPLLQPYTDNQYLWDLSINMLGEEEAQLVWGYWPFWNWLGYAAQFQTRSYEVLPDNQLPFFPSPLTAYRNELYRYVTRVPKMNARERVINAWQLELATTSIGTEGQPIPEGGFIIDQSTDWLYTWHEIPFANIPKASITLCSGHINDAIFDANAPDGQNFAIGTLLFRGVANELTPYKGPDGRLYIDLVYQFSYRPSGWNNYLRPDGTTVPIRYRISTIPGMPGQSTSPYRTADFNNLFTIA